MNIALIGMPGTMKTSVGKALSEMTGMRFIDTDEEFEREEGRKISEVFATDGEEYFRARETETVKRVAAENGCVISCGGGVVLREENVDALRSGCAIVLLTATAECIFERTSHSLARPLLAGGGFDRIKRMTAERAGAYEAAAQYVFDTTDRVPRDIAEEITEKLGLRLKLKQ